MSNLPINRIVTRAEGAQGNIYVFNFVVTLGAAVRQDLLLITPAFGNVYMQRYTTAAGQTVNSTFEGSTITANGSAGTFLSLDRTATRPANTLIFDTPTVSADGTQIDNEVNALGVKLQRENVWWRLAQSTNYLIVTTSSPAGNDVVMSVRILEEND